MSKNIIIQVGGTPKNLTADKLQTALAAGGHCLWVPEDETRLTTKSISKNGTYNASDDDAYGYSNVTVNVRGGNGSADSHGKPNTSGDTKPGGSGSAVMGVNPETGNEEVVGVDEEENLVTTPIPSAIKIIAPPTKTEYVDGETIDYSGIIVGLKKKDGTTFTDAKYMNGHIPMGELIFPVQAADASQASTDSTATSDLIDGNTINITPDLIVYYENGSVMSDFSSWDVGALVEYADSHNTYAVVANREPGRGSAYTYDGKTAYVGWYGGSFYPDSHANVERTIVPHGIDQQKIAWTMLYGDIKSGGTAEIPVQWKSSYDWREMEDQFEITITGSSEEDDGG